MKLFSSSFWLNSLFYTFLQRFSLFIFGAVAYIIMAHRFSPVTFSAWALFVVILSIIESVKNGLLRNPAIKFLSLPQYESVHHKVQFSSLIINILFSLSAVLIILLGSNALGALLKTPELDELLEGGVLIIILNIFFSHYEMLLQSRYHFNKILLANIVRQSFFLAGVIILSFSKEQFTLLNILYFQIAGYLTGTIIIGYAARKLIFKGLSYDRNVILHMLHFGKYTFGNNIFSQLSRTFDHTLTAYLLDPGNARIYVAYYNVVNRVNNMMDVPSLATADVAFPKNVTALQEDGMEKVKYQFERVAASILAIMIPLSVLICIFPQQVLYIIGGKDYYAAAVLLQLAMIFGWVRPLSYQFSSVMDAIGKPQVNFWMNLLFLGISFILHYFLLKIFGGIGAAIGIGILYMLLLFAMAHFLKRYIGVSMRSILFYIPKTYIDVFRMIKNRGQKKEGTSPS